MYYVESILFLSERKHKLYSKYSWNFQGYFQHKSGKIGLLQRTGNTQMESHPKNVVKTVACITRSEVNCWTLIAQNGIISLQLAPWNWHGLVHLLEQYFTICCLITIF